jgi:hypothetical protein
MPDAQTLAWLDQERRRTTQAIRTSGVFIQYVGGDPEALATPFAYTVGLHGIGHPELLVFGVSPSTASALLNEVASRIRGGRDLTPGEMLTFDDWAHRVVVEDLPNPAQILFAANSFYERPDELSVDAFQLTYDDTAGRFPWDDGYSVAPWIQPRPGEFSA